MQTASLAITELAMIVLLYRDNGDNGDVHYLSTFEKSPPLLHTDN